MANGDDEQDDAIEEHFDSVFQTNYIADTLIERELERFLD